MVAATVSPHSSYTRLNRGLGIPTNELGRGGPRTIITSFTDRVPTRGPGGWEKVRLLFV